MAVAPVKQPLVSSNGSVKPASSQQTKRICFINKNMISANARSCTTLISLMNTRNTITARHAEDVRSPPQAEKPEYESNNPRAGGR